MLDFYRPRVRKTGLATPVRNRYFYGKLMDVYHFELETEYFNQKRWLINRMILGYGVVCGLDVRAGSDSDTIYVTPGFALDGWGREIIVPEETQAISLLPGNGVQNWTASTAQSAAWAYGEEQEETGAEEYAPPTYDDEFDVHVVICYHECETDPVPVRAGDCETADPCAPGAVREQYRIQIREGLAEPRDYSECEIPNAIRGENVDYAVLANWVTNGCPNLRHDPCITLANVHVVVDRDGKRCRPDRIDITVRPIVYSNELLYQLILSLFAGQQRYRRDR